jgi:hypothetical protein
MDLDGIVDDFLDAVIVSFIEEENGLKSFVIYYSFFKKNQEKCTSDE